VDLVVGYALVCELVEGGSVKLDLLVEGTQLGLAVGEKVLGGVVGPVC
jgi:hypothetical protein